MQAWREKAKRLKLSDATISELVDDIAHVGDAEMRVMHEYGFEVEEIEDMMLDHNYERCPGCEWFKEVGELLDDNNEPKECDECDPRRFE